MGDGVYHRYDVFKREHHIIIEASAVEKIGAKVGVGIQRIPAVLIDKAMTLVLEHQFLFRNAVNKKRAAHYRHRFGPGDIFKH